MQPRFCQEATGASELTWRARAQAELMKRQSELEARRALGATLRAESESNRASAQEKARAARSKEDADSIEQEKAAAANDAMEAEVCAPQCAVLCAVRRAGMVYRHTPRGCGAAGGGDE